MCQPDTGAPARATLFVGHFVNHLVPNRVEEKLKAMLLLLHL